MALSLFIQMSDFYQDQCFSLYMGKVFAQMRAADPAACRVSAKFIDECTFDYHDLFSAPMTVWLEYLIFWPPDKSGACCVVAVQ